MKIAQVSATFPPYMAGTGNVCYHYAIELSKLGHDVAIFTSRYPDNDYRYPNEITVNRFKPRFRIGNAPFIPELYNVMDEFDLIHLHYPFYFGGEIIYLCNLIKNMRYVITYHNDVIAPGFLGLLFDIHRKLLAGKILKKAKKLFILSNDYTNYSNLKDIFFEKKRDLVVLPNGVDIDEFNPCLDSPPGFIKKSKTLLFVGSLDRAHAFKGLEYLLRACLSIANTYDDFILLIIGDGDLRKDYADFAKRIGILQNVRFLGSISSEDLPKYYSISDILILPSIRIENFPLVLIEAMAAGKPIVTSNIPGVRTIIKDYENGLLVQPADFNDLASKIIYLLNNPALCHEIGLENRKKAVTIYSWENIVKKLDVVYKEILSI